MNRRAFLKRLPALAAVPLAKAPAENEAVPPPILLRLSDEELEKQRVALLENYKTHKPVFIKDTVAIHRA